MPHICYSHGKDAASSRLDPSMPSRTSTGECWSRRELSVKPGAHGYIAPTKPVERRSHEKIQRGTNDDYRQKIRHIVRYHQHGRIARDNETDQKVGNINGIAQLAHESVDGHML